MKTLDDCSIIVINVPVIKLNIKEEATACMWL